MSYSTLPKYEGIPAQYRQGVVWVSNSAYSGGGYWAQYHAGEHLSYAQIEREWLDAGGPADAAPYMAYIAEYDESGGWTGAWNSAGATGLWQTVYPDSTGKFTRPELFNPRNEAKAAVDLYKQSGYAPWQGDTKRDLNIPPSATAPGSTTTDSVITGLTGGTSGLLGLFSGSSWKSGLERGGLILFGAVLLIVGVFLLASGSKVGVKLKNTAGNAVDHAIDT